MRPFFRLLLCSAAGLYCLLRGYQDLHNPSQGLPWITPYLLIALGGLALFSGFEAYFHREYRAQAPQPRITEYLTKGEKALFKTGGLLAVAIGLFFLSVSGWLAREQWTRVAQWPRVNAVLISKDISHVGARLIFQYEVRGQRLTGLGFRFGSEKNVRAALNSYKPGTLHLISYNPDDPGQIETVIGYNWELFRASICGATCGLIFVAGGAIVYRVT